MSSYKLCANCRKEAASYGLVPTVCPVTKKLYACNETRHAALGRESPDGTIVVGIRTNLAARRPTAASVDWPLAGIGDVAAALMLIVGARVR
jgi:hypothetical protein